MEITIADNQAFTLGAAAQKILTVPENGIGLCPVRDILDRIGDKWSMLSILHLGSVESLRFNELRKRIDGISQRMLTVTLRSLESDGLVARKVYAEVPPRVEYRLTNLGISLLEAMIEFGNWANEHAPQIAQARAAFAAKEQT
ncbi:winged helix-turn-helix transcriptional regulator [Hymenobacter sp. BT491]|uniref:winged helix-turn-helix transcriptional regulator n=1 Tax=Hymenobacter sp. BT491 TaxID=2766779 RepID=UPI001653A5F3|nr:helix-turn-helix domain-containing protein [Hymenobacter sp. BT491]MBC6989502.1 helix-turn-helix transcriptional regulator [Hymenobacter sp. BT491]